MLTIDSLISRQTLLLRAQIQRQAGKCESPTSPMSDALFKFIGQLDITWHAGDGVRSLRPSLSSHPTLSFKRAPRLMLNLKRLQGLSVLAFYRLKYISFFTSPRPPLLTELGSRLSWGGSGWQRKESYQR